MIGDRASASHSKSEANGPVRLELEVEEEVTGEEEERLFKRGQARTSSDQLASASPAKLQY